jgi:hypothetical protein
MQTAATRDEMSTNAVGATGAALAQAQASGNSSILAAAHVEPPASSAPRSAGNESAEEEDVVLSRDSFGIRLTDTASGRNSASMLISKMYAWRGYAGTHQLSEDPNRITLTATDKGEVVGTLTLGIDSPIGLMADQTFKEELDVHRARGAKLCEFTKLAFDPAVRSKTALANLFHLATIYARDIHGCSDIIIEVNPRHRRFYEHMLGFKREGGMKDNARVGAPAHLMRISLDYATVQIRKHGGTFSGGTTERSFYPYFFSEREELGIINRLKNLDAHKT